MATDRVLLSLREKLHRRDGTWTWKVWNEQGGAWPRFRNGADPIWQRVNC
jgi:hypothetical protein